MNLSSDDFEFFLEEIWLLDEFLGIFIFHLEISGSDLSDLHPLKILFILILLLNFHFEISGINVNDEQFSKIPFNMCTFLVFHFKISGNSSKDKHP